MFIHSGKKYIERSMYLIDPYRFAVPHNIIRDGLVVYYPLDKDSLDYSGNNLHMTGNYVEGIGKIGKCHKSIPKTNSVLSQSVNGISMPTGSSPRTLCFWVKLNSYPTEIVCGITGYGYDGGGSLFIISSMNSSYANKLYLWNNGSGYISSHVVPLNIWTHVCVTYSGNIIKFYMNATPDSGGDISLSTADGGFRVNYSNIYSEFDGSIDEILLYNRVLSQEEITQIYNNI